MGWQSDYKLSVRSFWFGGLHYDADKFSGFDYQTSLITGYGNKFFDTDTYKFSSQLGAGFRRSKNSLTGRTKGDVIATAGLNLERAAWGCVTTRSRLRV